MSTLQVAPIVEGHGEDIAVRKLLERIWYEIVHGAYINVLRPIRIPRTKFLRWDDIERKSRPDFDEIRRAVLLAQEKLKLHRQATQASLVLLMLDAEPDCPKHLIHEIWDGTFEHIVPPNGLSIIFPNVEYETWFVAAAESLSQFLRLDPNDTDIAQPEERRCGKGWIERRFTGEKYSETVDQVKMTARMDLTHCRRNSPSFDKLCRELERHATDQESYENLHT